jgi:hypothetical protein
MSNSKNAGGLSRRAFTLSTAGAVAGWRSAARAQQSQLPVLYNPIELGYLSGYGGIKAIALNQRGQVVGNVDNSVLQANEAFVWTEGGKGGPPENPEMRPLGNLSGRPDWIFNGSLGVCRRNQRCLPSSGGRPITGMRIGACRTLLRSRKQVFGKNREGRSIQFDIDET